MKGNDSIYDSMIVGKAKILNNFSTMTRIRGVARIFPSGGGGQLSDLFLEKYSLLVDRLGSTSRCYIEVKQKGGLDPLEMGSPLVMPLSIPVTVTKLF